MKVGTAVSLNWHCNINFFEFRPCCRYRKISSKPVRMCAVTQSADSAMFKQFSLSVMAFCIDTAVQERSTRLSWGAYHICEKRHKTVLVFTSEDSVSVKLVSHENFMEKHVCLCP